MPAYAKVNLALTILRKRNDGFHDLITVMQRISLSDEVSVKPLEGEVIYTGPNLTDDIEDNLCVRAVRAFQKRFGDQYGASIRLTKRIPIGAGLGGGSSDAAILLTLMEKLYNLPYSNEELFDIALELGSDVPFFLSGYPAALAEGQGERLSQVPGLDPSIWIVVVWSGISVSTSWAYNLADNYLTFSEKRISITVPELRVWGTGRLMSVRENDFEIPIFSKHPDLASVCSVMRESGSIGAGLSGSGSALFGLFNEEATAQRVIRTLPKGWTGYLCRPC